MFPAYCVACVAQLMVRVPHCFCGMCKELVRAAVRRGVEACRSGKWIEEVRLRGRSRLRRIGVDIHMYTMQGIAVGFAEALLF